MVNRKHVGAIKKLTGPAGLVILFLGLVSSGQACPRPTVDVGSTVLCVEAQTQIILDYTQLAEGYSITAGPSLSEEPEIDPSSGAEVSGLVITWTAPGIYDVVIKAELDYQGPGYETGTMTTQKNYQFTVLKVDLDIDGLNETDEDVVGGLVVRNHDSNNAPRKKITIQKFDPNTYSGNVILTRNSTKAKAFTASTGGSEITFNGTDNKFANSALPMDLYVEGSEQSATLRDVQIKAEAEGVSECTDSVSFTVLWVEMAAGKHSGTMSSDNAATNSYYWNLTVNPNRFDLGPGEFNDRFGRATEFRGDVFPTNFVPSEFGVTMHLARTKDVYSYYSDPSTNGSDLFYHSTGADTSPSSVRDDDPQSGGSAGKIYDCDGPGIPKNESGDAVDAIRRYRGNFHEFANVFIGGVRFPPFFGQVAKRGF